MLGNHGSQEATVRELLYWACLAGACRLALPIHGDFCDAKSTSTTTCSGCERGRTGLPPRATDIWHLALGNKAIHRRERLAPGSASRPATPPVVEAGPRCHPITKKGAAMWLAGPQQSPEGCAKGRDAGKRAGAPLSGWRAPARLVGEKKQEKQKKKRRRRGSRGALLRRGPLPIDHRSTA